MDYNFTNHDSSNVQNFLYLYPYNFSNILVLDAIGVNHEYNHLEGEDMYRNIPEYL